MRASYALRDLNRAVLLLVSFRLLKFHLASELRSKWAGGSLQPASGVKGISGEIKTSDRDSNLDPRVSRQKVSRGQRGAGRSGHSFHPFCVGPGTPLWPPPGNNAQLPACPAAAGKRAGPGSPARVHEVAPLETAGEEAPLTARLRAGMAPSPARARYCYCALRPSSELAAPALCLAREEVCRAAPEAPAAASANAVLASAASPGPLQDTGNRG